MGNANEDETGSTISVQVYVPTTMKSTKGALAQVCANINSHSYITDDGQEVDLMTEFNADDIVTGSFICIKGKCFKIT